MKTFGSLGLALLFVTTGCREKPIDQGALITARTVGLDDLQRGRLVEAEQEFRKVIALAPRDPLGYANLGLTYLRAGRYGDAASQLERARRLDPANVDVALTLAKLYSLTNRRDQARSLLEPLATEPRALYALAELEREDGNRQRYAERLGRVLARAPANLAVRLQLADAFLSSGAADSTQRYLEDVRQLRPEPPREAKPHLEAAIQALRAKRLTEARAELDRFVRLMEITAPYQAALAKTNWTEGPLVGRPVLDFKPASLIAMRGVTPPSSTGIHFTDITDESGLPDLGAAPTALALGDYDGDAEDNLLIAAPNVQMYTLRRGFVANAGTSIPLPAGAHYATFADYDNDGWLDLFVIGADGRGYLLHNRAGKRFEDVTKAAGVRDVDGARRALFVDLDHDGDLDLLLVGNNSLAAYRNNLDGTFTLFPNADGIVLGGTDAVFGDVDDDGRTDVFVTSQAGLDGLFHNGGVRGYTRTADTIRGPGPVAIGDYDNDGALDLYVGGTGLWHNDGSGRFAPDTRSAAVFARLHGGDGSAVFMDYDNDGWLDLLVAAGAGGAGGGPRGLALFHNEQGKGFVDRSAILPPEAQRDSIGPLLVADLDGDGDPDILFGDRSGVHLLRNDGGNAHLGMQVQLTALRTGSGKNNTFGIGSRLEVRAGELYQTRVVTSRVTPFGLGSHFKADVLRVQWTNGVPQTIYFPGTDQDVLEMQQLKGSCAFLYAWNGTGFEFITDVMWRSALGMPVGIMGNGNANYAPAGASQEYVRIPGEALKPRNGRYVLQVTEELWETAYLDQLRLLAVDHPDSVDVFVDERFPPASTGLQLFQVVHRRPPLSAVDERGADVLDELREHDYRYVSNLTPLQYQGLTEPHALTLDLDVDAGSPGTLLVLRGWIFPSDASINVALSQQQSVRAELPVLEVRDARGRWVSRGSIGFPAGKDKTVVVDLSGIFPTLDRHVRIRTNLQVYWDQAFVADDIGAGSAQTKILAPVSGLLHYRGFSRMYRRGGRYGPQWFAYDDVAKASPWRPITGAATRYGDVTPLLDRADDQYIIMVPGDETTVEFDAGSAVAPRPGWTRTFLLYSDGWIKDSDLNTADGTTIGPLPYHAVTSYPYSHGDAYPTDPARQRYLGEYNTRIIPRPSLRPGAREEH